MSALRVKTPYVPHGDVLDFPQYHEMSRKVSRGEDIRFTLTLDELRVEVQVLNSSSRSISGDTETWCGVVCPIDALDTGIGSSAIKITKIRGNATYL